MVTSKTPFVTDTVVPVEFPDAGTAEKKNVPAMRVGVATVTVTLPVPAPAVSQTLVPLLVFAYRKGRVEGSAKVPGPVIPERFKRSAREPTFPVRSAPTRPYVLLDAR
jgi:hypothetical protein